MALDFRIGFSDRPRGHALVFFRTSGGEELMASYLVVLPIAMDMGKYLPPLLASQLGGMAGGMLGEGMSAFAAPPVPEAFPGGLAGLERLARLREDDLLDGGTIPAGDISAAMAGASGAAEEYHRLYEAYAGSTQASEASEPDGPRAVSETPGDAGLQQVLYELMPERERLGEFSKLVGTLRFAAERSDATLLQETEDALQALAAALPPHFWPLRVIAAAKDASPAGARLAQLYMERCYKLADEDFRAVGELEKRIAEAGG